MRRRLKTSALAGMVMTLAGHATGADALPSREAQMKAAYVFNFLKFIEWQKPVSIETLEVCFLGAKDVLEALAISSTDKTVGSRRIAVRPMTTPDTDLSARCDVLYVDASEDLTSQSPAHRESILTIGDADDFTEQGGVIRLHMESNRLRFTINVDNAKRSGLYVSSNLLKLATRVEQESTP